MRSVVKAQFKGADGSLGYIRHQVYELRIYAERPGAPITISRFDGSGKCPYASLEAFLANWTPLDDSAVSEGDA